MDTVAVLERLPFYGREADRYGPKNALLDKADDFVNPVGRATGSELQLANQPAALNLHILPASNRERGIVIKQGHRIGLEIVEHPSLRVDDVAHPVFGGVRQNECERVAGGQGHRGFVDDGHELYPKVGRLRKRRKLAELAMQATGI